MESGSTRPLGWVDALILDLDGVLIDSEPVHLDAWKQALADMGRPVPHELGRTTLGWRTVDVAAWLAEQVDLDAADLLASRNDIVTRAVGRYAPFPGWPDTRRRLRELGIPLAIASSGTREHVARATRELGLTDDLRTSRCGEDVSSGKPQPDVYLAVLADLEVEAACAVAFEDSPNGVRAAVSAGVPVIAISAVDEAAAEATTAVSTLQEAVDIVARLVRRGTRPQGSGRTR